VLPLAPLVARLCDTSHLPNTGSQSWCPALLQGYYLPTFHKNYWLGLQANDDRRWSWMDPTSLPSYYNSKYVNWGVKAPENVPEPDNAEPPESCVVANFTEARPEQSPYRAGWADTSCINSHPAMCRFASKLLCPCCASASPAVLCSGCCHSRAQAAGALLLLTACWFACCSTWPTAALQHLHEQLPP
jgi:hypothetical protein